MCMDKSKDDREDLLGETFEEASVMYSKGNLGAATPDCGAILRGFAKLESDLAHKGEGRLVIRVYRLKQAFLTFESAWREHQNEWHQPETR